MTAIFRPAAHVRNPAKYYDRTVQEWHATTLGRDCSAIDIDLMGFCRKCSEPLYLIEAAETEQKSTRVVERLGLLAGIPALLVVHAGGLIRKAKRVDIPKTGEWRSADELVEYLDRLRRLHECEP